MRRVRLSSRKVQFVSPDPNGTGVSSHARNPDWGGQADPIISAEREHSVITFDNPYDDDRCTHIARYEMI